MAFDIQSLFTRGDFGCKVVLLFLTGFTCTATLAVRAQTNTPHSDASSVRFERMAMDWQLPQSSVYSIVEDHEGFIWFGTREGLGRWDGFTMRTWKANPFDPASLPNNIVLGLIEDTLGNLWISTEAGIARLGPDRQLVQRYFVVPGLVFLDNSGIAWFATSTDFFRFNSNLNLFERVASRARESGRLSAVLMDRDGAIWTSDARNILLRCDVTSDRCDSVAQSTSKPCPGDIQRLLEDTAGKVWAGTNLGLCRVEASGTLLSRWIEAPRSLNQTRTSMMKQDAHGNVWVATWGGIFRIDPGTNEIRRFTLNLAGDIETQNIVWSICIDRAGGVWAGTNWGVYRYDPNAKPFLHMGHDPGNPNSLSSGLISTLLEDVNGALWIGSIGGGLNRVVNGGATQAHRGDSTDDWLGRGNFHVEHFRNSSSDPHSLSSDIVWTIAEDLHQDLWIGTNDGVNRLNRQTGTFDIFRMDPTWRPTPGSGATGRNTVTAMHVDEDGRLWIGTYANKLLRWEPEHQSFVTILDSLRGAIRSFASEGRNILWIGTENAGLIRLDLRTAAQTLYQHEDENVSSLSSNLIWTIHPDSSEILWLGTNNGLVRFDRGTGLATHFTEQDGLHSAVVYGIIEDDLHRMWLSTNRGLTRFDDRIPSERNIRNFDINDGLRNIEFNRGAYLRLRDGTLLFGGDQGVSYFKPASIRDNPTLPPVVFTTLQISTKDGVTTQKSLDEHEIVVGPQDLTFSIEFVALNFTNPQRNRYASKLEGFENQWVELSTRRIARYTNVPPGHYVFRVRGSNDDGIWNEEGASIGVNVLPAFWQTLWFRILAAGFTIGSIALVVRRVSIDRYQRRLRAAESKQALEQERSRISRDMHDEVGANLTEIAIMSELARMEKDLPQQVDERLDHIADSARDTLDSIGEIIWAINPENDRLDRLVAYLHKYSAEYLEDTNIKDTLRFENDIPDLIVSAEFRRNVFLVLKESLHNLIRHAGATEAIVDLRIDDAQLELRIEDDGQGFDIHSVKLDSNGLRNMKYRATEIGGDLKVTSTPADGTSVLVRIPLQQTRDSTTHSTSQNHQSM